MGRLKYWREFRGMTQAQLASAAKVGLRNIIVYEQGRGNPTHSTQAKLAKVLGCKVADLLE